MGAASGIGVLPFLFFTVLCHQADLPVFVMVTAAHVHDSQLGWLILLLSVILYGLRVLIVCADAAYFDGKIFKVVHNILHAHLALHYNLRRSGRRKLVTLFFGSNGNAWSLPTHRH